MSAYWQFCCSYLVITEDFQFVNATFCCTLTNTHCNTEAADKGWQNHFNTSEIMSQNENHFSLIDSETARFLGKKKSVHEKVCSATCAAQHNVASKQVDVSFFCNFLCSTLCSDRYLASCDSGDCRNTQNVTHFFLILIKIWVYGQMWVKRPIPNFMKIFALLHESLCAETRWH